MIVADDMCEVEARSGRPAGYRGCCIRHKQIWYVGDTVDDARSAQAAAKCRSSASPMQATRDAMNWSDAAASRRTPSPSRRHQLIGGRSYDENASYRAQHQRNADFRRICASKAQGRTRSPPASASSITCWSCSPKHGGFDLKLQAKGDLDVDQHHTVEDVGIVLGQLVLEGAGRPQGHQPRRLLRAADGRDAGRGRASIWAAARRWSTRTW